MRLDLGSAPDSWGVWFGEDPRQMPWLRFLDEVAAAGYEWIELGPYGYLPTHLPTLRAELAARGLRVTGSFIDGALHQPGIWPAIKRRAQVMSELLAGLDATYLVLMTTIYADPYTGAPLGPRTLSPDAWGRLCDVTHRLADLVQADYGLRLVFHPHAGMYIETEAEIETFLAATDPGKVGLCLDTGQHLVAGGDPIAFLRRHHQRILYLHLKNVDGTVLRRVHAESIPLNGAVPLGLYCEPDKGLIDFPALFATLATLDYRGWGIVEQNMFPTDFDRPLPIARRSRAYLLDLLARIPSGREGPDPATTGGA